MSSDTLKYINIIYLTLIIISLKYKKHILKYIIALIHFIRMVSFKMIIFVIIGYLLSAIAIKVSYYITYRKSIKVPNFLRINKYIFINAIMEEILWRDSLIYFFSKYPQAYLIQFFVYIFSSLLFLLIHKVKDLGKNIEMFVYIIFLVLGSKFFYGIHYGLHIGRNMIISNME